MCEKEVKVEIKKFDGTNFGYQRMQIEDDLYEKRLQLSLLGKKSKSLDDIK